MTAHPTSHYPASRRGVPAYSVLGPCACKDCGTLLWYAHSQTREGWNGPVIKGLLKWRERGGKVHKHPKAKAA